MEFKGRLEQLRGSYLSGKVEMMGLSSYGGVLDRDSLIVLAQGETETVFLGSCLRTGRSLTAESEQWRFGVKDSRREREECADADDGIAFKAVTKGH